MKNKEVKKLLDSVREGIEALKGKRKGKLKIRKVKK